MSSRTTTIHDVARAAGVATSTVSRALAGEPRISPATRDRVREAAHRLSYAPSRSARSLRSARTGAIGLLSPTLENPIAHDHLQTTVRLAFEAGYTVFVADAQDAGEIQDASLARMREYRVDGLVLGRGMLMVTPALLEFLASGVPVEPALDPVALAPFLGSRVTAYRERAALDGIAATVAYRRLLELGHRRFGFFSLSPGTADEPRYRSLMREFDAVPGASASLLIIPEDDPARVVAEVQRLAVDPNAPTAYIAGSGRLTPYLLEGMHSAGLRLPADASLLAFGDSQWHRAVSPQLAVVREDYAATARQAVTRLVARIEGSAVPSEVSRPSEFVPRGSIGPAPGSGTQPTYEGAAP